MKSLRNPAIETPTGRALLVNRKALQVEAERRARAGERQVDISRELQIPRSTLAIWAAMGGWRGKDLKREREGLPPLPRPYYARMDRDVTAGSKKRPTKPDPPAEVAPLPAPRDLKGEAARLGVEARAAFEAGDLEGAEAKLKQAARLTRLHRALQTFAPAVSPLVAAARARVLAMDEAELMDEIRRLAGLE
ncbi:MAG: hypothetical protein AAGJ50_13075 [Pseudomonadota bacterium]